MNIFNRVSARFSVSKAKNIERPRLVIINNRQVHSFSGNFIKTSRYTIVNFVPKYLFEQFCRPVNFYFLIIAILQIFPSITTTNSVPTLAFPLAFVLIIGAIKDGWEDVNRHNSDLLENERDVIRIRRLGSPNFFQHRVIVHTGLTGNSIGTPDYSPPIYQPDISVHQKMESILDHRMSWKLADFGYIEGIEDSVSRDLKVGDIVLIRNHEIVPADVVLLTSSSDSGEVFLDTSSLDGESNLKRRFSHKSSSTILGFNIETAVKRACMLEGLIECSQPGKDLHIFDGTAIIRLPPSAIESINYSHKTVQFPINLDNLILRGCILRSTEWALGCIVYAGHESKIQMNSLKPRKKMSNVDKLTNKMVLLVLVFLFTLCLTGALLTQHYMSINFFDRYPYLGYSPENESSFRATGQAVNPTFVPLIRFCTWLVLLANIIPIALIVSMKIVKAIQGYFISKDRAMFNAIRGTYAASRNSDLNEDLGQVKYLFSDKTGTLTRNIMEFRAISVNGIKYGMEHFNENEIFESPIPQVNFYDDKIFEHISKNKLQRDKIGQFLLNIAVNNSIVIENQTEIYKELLKHNLVSTTLDDNLNIPMIEDEEVPESNIKARTIKSIPFLFTEDVEDISSEFISEKNMPVINCKPFYSAQYSDEAALCYGAQYLGVSLLCIHPLTKDLIVNIFGHLVYVEILAIIPFTSERRRSSVIARIKSEYRDPDSIEDTDQESFSLFQDRIVVFCKGADSAIKPLLSCHDSLNCKLDFKAGDEMASVALRVLCIAQRIISEEEFVAWYEKYSAALNSVEFRDEQLYKVTELIERDLELQGVTGVEDRLQDNVPETINCLREANISVWMLTGDRVETAKEIANSAGLITSNNMVFELTQKTCYDTRQTKILLFEIGKSLGIFSNRKDFSWRNNLLNWFTKDQKSEIEKSQTSMVIEGTVLNEVLSGSITNTEELERNEGIDEYEKVCSSLSSVEQYLIKLCCLCHTVVFARCTPSQKGQIIRFVRKYMNGVTLAIGDGANDCNMLQMANVGVGIRGLEGNQAFLASDYGVTMFKDIQTLLFVHGRLAYRRMCKLALYMFYKNLTVGIPIFIYGYFNMWSGTRLYYDYWYQVYNVLFSSVPIIIIALFDFDVTKEESLSSPKIYLCGPMNELLNLRVCLIYLLTSIWHSFVVFFTPYILFSFNSTNMFGSTQSVVGATIYCLIIITVNIKALLMADHMHYFLGFGIFFSFLSWICCLFVCSSSSTIGSDVLSLWIPLGCNVFLWISLLSGLSFALWPDYFVGIISRRNY
ncbi:phospholipid-translocating P-type ATPase, flippase family protein [Cryptosporidium muris RN66]|uniref:Phospholipid-translocating P-type ATPase, flippase family protein n=1 Tax=Cryptosporidium muris (strain RN66) TaxID=441375 RepID=B6AFK3_CRYMR|nr:phospholipid-translocating P-type ATPase, flippase family protein [Cryptosporidium muris RN66]EEA06994.1 phospholipid-translocating P-type ATPase, flippase family protein [Cryptosporidium muris RN66]|eukprot:XP_002141343.1 phospholipid-translocating P-type ATPase, flippase family protein [Cryptosporidium muris RN66]